eukprot:gb/GECG01002884.1/.p1 GENE.gb/GECG01002884.1/~~gb/GECG01002884.1/.p1  ORF type:complete len:1178 (+),score=233.70 gb/GECG01002884.1/:1-3534(+)
MEANGKMQKYRTVKAVGKGSFGKAFLVERKADKEKFVLKQVNLSQMSRKERREAENEVKLLQSLRHPNIVAYEEAFQHRGNLCIVMEYADSGDLAGALKNRRGRKLSEGKILDWLVQICLALKHLHDRKILHRDLKTANIFVSNPGILKLGDFGIAKVLTSTGELAKTAIGTPYYLSPEICKEHKYNNKSDIWSLGCILYEMVTLKLPFEAPNMRLLVQKILRGRFSPITDGYSKDLKNLINDMLTVNPRSRPGVMSILNRPFIRNRINNFLSEAAAQEELGHTIIHGKHAIKDAKDIMNQAIIRDHSSNSLHSAPSREDSSKEEESKQKPDPPRRNVPSQEENRRGAAAERDRPNYLPVRSIQQRLNHNKGDNRSQQSARSQQPESSRDQGNEPFGRNGAANKEPSSNRQHQAPQQRQMGPRGGINAWRPSAQRSAQNRDQQQPKQSNANAANDQARQRAHERAIKMAKERAAERYQQAMEAREKARKRAAEAEERRRQMRNERANECRRRKANLDAMRGRAAQKVNHRPDAARPAAPQSAERGLQADPNLKVKPRESNRPKPSRYNIGIQGKGLNQEEVSQKKPSSARSQQSDSSSTKNGRQGMPAQHQKRREQLRHPSSQRSADNESHKKIASEQQQQEEEANNAYMYAMLRQQQRSNGGGKSRQDHSDAVSGHQQQQGHAGYLDAHGNIRLSKYAAHAAREKLADKSQAERRQKVVAAADQINQRVGHVVQRVRQSNAAARETQQNRYNAPRRSSGRDGATETGQQSRDYYQQQHHMEKVRVSPVLSPSQQKQKVETFSLDNEPEGARFRNPACDEQEVQKRRDKNPRLSKREQLWEKIQADKKNHQQRQQAGGPTVEIYAPSGDRTSSQESSVPSSATVQGGAATDKSAAVKPQLSLDSVEERDASVENMLRQHVDEDRVKALLEHDTASGEESYSTNSTPNFEPEYDESEHQTGNQGLSNQLSTMSISSSNEESETNEGYSDECTGHQYGSISEEDEKRAEEVKDAKQYNDYVDMLQTMHELDKTLTGIMKKKSPEEHHHDAQDSSEDSAEWISSDSEAGRNTGADRDEDNEDDEEEGDQDNKEDYGYSSQEAESHGLSDKVRRLRERIRMLKGQLKERLGETTFETAHNVVLSEKPQQAAKTVMQLLGADNIDALEHLLELCMLETRATE